MSRRSYREMGTCEGCRHLDWVDKKWWGCTTKVCTYKSRMGKALPQHRPSWCPLGNEPVPEGVQTLNTVENCSNIAREVRLCDIFDAVRSKADENGRITIVDHFKISGISIFAEDLISFIEYAINTTGENNEADD